MVTVAATRGSAPREAGARLVVNPDGSFTGTIGGGTLEWRAIALAQAALARAHGKPAELRRFVLGPDWANAAAARSISCSKLIGSDRERRSPTSPSARQPVPSPRPAGNHRARRRRGPSATDDPAGHRRLRAGSSCSKALATTRRPLLLFGAGHVGRALVLALAPLPFAVNWVDPRPDAFPAYVPANVDLEPARRSGGRPCGCRAREASSW